MTIWLLIAVMFCNACSGGKPAAINTPDSNNEQTMSVPQDHEPIQIDKMIGTADLIVEGKIEKAGTNSLTVSVISGLKGETVSKQIDIKQYQPDKFEGGVRSIPYQNGQTYLFFLRKPDIQKDKTQAWVIMGYAGEGEMPVSDGYIYFPARFVEGLAYTDQELFGTKQHLQRYNFQEFILALTDYQQCFKWVKEASQKPNEARPVSLCDKIKSDKLSSVSQFHKYLISLTNKRLEVRN